MDNQSLDSFLVFGILLVELLELVLNDGDEILIVRGHLNIHVFLNFFLGWMVSLGLNDRSRPGNRLEASQSSLGNKRAKAKSHKSSRSAHLLSLSFLSCIIAIAGRFIILNTGRPFVSQSLSLQHMSRDHRLSSSILPLLADAIHSLFVLTSL